METVRPPKLISLFPTLEKIPKGNIPWIVEKHLKYLDDKFHEIDKLTDYLDSCSHVEAERNEFVEFVLNWMKQDTPAVEEYLNEYAKRYHSVRSKVEKQCDQILLDDEIWKTKDKLVRFWQDFCFINEVDSLHGMFLTSGRWQVNVMLPIVKELITCWLPESINLNLRSVWSYQMARKIITPEFAEKSVNYDPKLEKSFIAAFVPILQFFDRKLLFLFDVFSKMAIPEFPEIKSFIDDVVKFPYKYSTLIEQGVYPPFAWHELLACRKPRQPIPDFRQIESKFLLEVPEQFLKRAESALYILSVFKEYELNYNNYNYKGRFNLVSKQFYLRTSNCLSKDAKTKFLDAIIGDRFYEALEIIENCDIHL